jgi:NADPH-dependent curcumin reductase CurA
LHAACARGADVYFDNVGGSLLENILPLIVNRGRIVCCGVTAQYDMDDPLPGPSDLAVQMIANSLRMEGFLVANYRDSWNEALRELKELHESGQLTVLEDLRDGLASAPTALIEMLAGKNVGQLAVRLVPDPVGWPSE